MTLYDLNKIAYLQVPEMNQEQYQKAAAQVWQSLSKESKYYMLLCREKNDYTVFKIKNIEEDYSQLWNTILEILQEDRNYIIKDVEGTESGYIEYWVQDKEEEQCYMYILFPYDWGVIEL